MVVIRYLGVTWGNAEVVKLTERRVKSIQPLLGFHAIETPDALMVGLYLVTQPTGSKSWAIRYRYKGKPRKLTLGKTPGISLVAARRMARESLAAVAEGRDPAGEKAAARRPASPESTFPYIAAQFIEKHCMVHNRTWKEQARQLGLAPWKIAAASPHLEHRWRTIDGGLAQRWGRTPLAAITRRDVLAVLDDAVARGAGTSANRLLAVLRKLFGWCVARDLIHESPIVGLSPPTPEFTRDKVLSEAEIRVIWQAADKLNYPFNALIWLLLLTGQRRGEVAGIRESEIEGDVWLIPAARAKNNQIHCLPLSRAAQRLITRLPRTKSGLLLTGNGRTPISGFSKVKRRLDSVIGDAISEHWVLHDLRRSASTGMASLGIPPHICEAVLNHQSGTVRGVARTYNRFKYEAEKRGALERWAAHLEKIIR